MLKAGARWKITKPDEKTVNELASELDISVIAARFLVQRGYTDIFAAKSFLHKDSSSLHDPFLLKDMNRAVERIKRGIENSEKILVFGDYDADGVTSTSLLFLTLKQLGADAGYYVPNRFTEGYGPNENAFRQGKEEGVSLIITVDTGISAVHEAEVANELDIDLIITDHHEPPPQIPDALAVVNPKQDDCEYPNQHLAGVGVAFKLSHALLGRFPEEYLDLVAIGTIADLVPLIGENRYLAAAGIRQLSQSQRPGIKVLLEECGADATEITEEQIGFLIGPRLNAAGRMDSADPAVQLLLCEDPLDAYELAGIIEDLNKERQKIVTEMTKEAEAEVEKQGIPPVIIVGHEGWNAGVIGIVASRLVEKFYRPTIVLSLDSGKGLAKGSARSIAGFDIFQSLSQCREWLPHFGGHPMAAGLTMKIEHIDLLHEKLIDIAKQEVAPEDWEKSLTVDLPVNVPEVTTETIKDLQHMAPFGVGNPSPKILIENVHLGTIKKIGAKEDHLKLTLCKDDAQLDGIGFRKGELADEISPLSPLSVVGQLSINEWNGYVKPQVIIEDVKIDEWQLFDLRGDRKPWTKLPHHQASEITVIFFRNTTTAVLPQLPDEWTTFSYADLAGKDVDMEGQYVLLLDLPETFEQLKLVFAKQSAVSRIYAAFLHEKDHFFDMMPTREHFKWFYAMLLKKQTFDMNKHAELLAKHKGWTVNAVRFMCQVFFELEFVKINNGVVAIEKSPQKKDLTDSPTYRKQIEQAEIENELFYSSVTHLKQWFSKVLNEKALTHMS
ncbi:single-stranded-DNA-specific exonuclease [Evansella caseinilytica]|uniref:Single-stranded-DNA-specific exonuclease RecJ n=1 Tax=Evansella caseinilytica TaxID=1503961 RepID=A0A1H3K8I5_9BACI|nr:single-stranded-DNA-specific exonuclease RecJ [Evansella caseinilytica]SDY47898.1 single-stranded-DNA-specific exonuclease [Evansella caseinilytica]